MTPDAMKNTRTRTLALVVVATFCLLALPAVVQAAPAQDTAAERAAAERVDRSIGLQDLVLSLFERLRAVVTGTPTSGDDDQMPGSSMDPDGNRPDTR